MSAWKWWLVLAPAVWVAGVWVIRICRYNARTIREWQEQALYDRLFNDIVNRLTEERS